MVDACHGDDGNPGLELGLWLGEGWRSGRDKVCLDADADGLRAVGGAAARGVDRQAGEGPRAGARRAARAGRTAIRGEVRIARPVRPRRRVLPVGVRDRGRRPRARDQPVRPARRAGGEGQDGRGARGGRAGHRAAGLARRPARRRRATATTSRSRRSSTPRASGELAPLAARARETGCVVTTGLGPRYLHSTGQLHKGGPNTGLFVQVVDETGDEIPIPGRDFGFGRLMRAQAAGDLAALEERGRRAVRVRLEEL